MKPLMLLGVLLSAFGLVCLLVPTVRCGNRKTVADTRSVHITVKTEKFISLPPVLGAVSLAAGLTMMILAARR